MSAATSPMSDRKIMTQAFLASKVFNYEIEQCKAICFQDEGEYVLFNIFHIKSDIFRENLSN